MARNYTPEEQQAAIDKLIRPSVRREYGSLGNRKENVSFGDVQDAAAGVFILYPSAPFYVVRLGRDVLAERVTLAENTLNDLLDTVRATGRKVHPVTKISSLANARAALGALEVATAERTSSLARIEEVPAYQRFEQSTARFLADEGSKTRSSGDTVQTPEEARSRLAGLISQLMEQYDDVLSRTGYISGAIEDFDNLQLGARLSNDVVANSRSVISSRFDEMDSKTPQERLAVLRDVVLDVLVTRSTVKGFGALTPTTTFLYFSGNAAPYADASHPATSATLLSDFGEPYTVLDDTTLAFTMDGTTSFSVDIPQSYVAAVENFIVEPFAIDGATPGQENDKLFISVTNYALLSVNFTAGATRYADQVAADINAAVGARPIIAEPYGPQLYLRGEPVNIFDISMTSVKNFQRLAGDWTGIDVRVGDSIQVTAGDPSNVGWWNVLNVGGLPTQFQAAKSFGSPVQELGGTAVIDMNRGGRGLRIRFTDAARQAAVDGRWRIGIPLRPTPTSDSDPIVERFQQILGMPYDSTFQCEGTRAADIVTFINDNPIIALGGTAALEAAVELSSLLWNGALRSDPFDSTKVILSKLEATGVVTGASFVGLLGTITLENLSADPTQVGVHVGDQLVIRSSPKTDQVGRYGLVSVVTATLIEVTITFGSTVVDLGDAWSIEVGPDLSSEQVPMTLVVEAGLVNSGTYAVGFLGGVDGAGPSWELGLERPLVQYTELGGQTHRFTGRVGRQHVRLSSRRTLLDTEIAVEASSTAGSLLLSALPATAVGDTVFMQLGSRPLKVEAEDFLELHQTGAQLASFVFEIVRTETNPNLLELSSTIPTTFGSWAMSQDSPPPYGRVRKRKKNNFDTLKAAVDDWLELPTSNAGRYFAQLRRLLNPIIVNSNPTASSINDVVNHLFTMQTHLSALQGDLEGYEAPLVEQVDRLIDTYYQYGSERAVDVLVQGRFSDFFGLDQDDVSYSGRLQKSLRSVEVEDLPQSKFKRNPGGEVIDSYEEPDFEFDFSDTQDDSEDVYPPGESYDFGDESAF
jgi:hypothetical protein